MERREKPCILDRGREAVDDKMDMAKKAKTTSRSHRRETLQATIEFYQLIREVNENVIFFLPKIRIRMNFTN
jgi:hypothetical protein